MNGSALGGGARCHAHEPSCGGGGGGGCAGGGAGGWRCERGVSRRSDARAVGTGMARGLPVNLGELQPSAVVRIGPRGPSAAEAARAGCCCCCCATGCDQCRAPGSPRLAPMPPPFSMAVLAAAPALAIGLPVLSNAHKLPPQLGRDCLAALPGVAPPPTPPAECFEGVRPVGDLDGVRLSRGEARGEAAAPSMPPAPPAPPALHGEPPASASRSSFRNSSVRHSASRRSS